MNWQNILKIKTEDAIRDAKRFAPDVIDDDILRMIDDLESKTFSYGLEKKELEKVKDAFNMLREMFKDYPVEQQEEPIIDTRLKGVEWRFSDE